MRTLSAIVAFTAAYAVVTGAPPDKAEEEDLTESESQTSYGYGYGTKVEDDHRYDQFQKCWNVFVRKSIIAFRRKAKVCMDSSCCSSWDFYQNLLILLIKDFLDNFVFVI